MARRRIGEFELIARYFAPLAKDFAGAGGLRSDNAFLAGESLIAMRVETFEPDKLPPDLAAIPVAKPGSK